jgi:uncharacterized protein
MAERGVTRIYKKMKKLLVYFLVNVSFVFGLCAQTKNDLKDPRLDPHWQETRYGEWGGPGVSSRPGAMDSILLKDYAPKSSVVTKQTLVPKARFPVIDVHAHILARTSDEVADWVRTMDDVGVDITVVLTGVVGEDFDRLAEIYLKPYPNRFHLYCGIDLRNINSPNFSQQIVKELERCYRMGARGVGELSDKGDGLRSVSGFPPQGRIHPDDPRLEAFWKKCAELHMPINLHVADHPSAWQPLDVYQERTPDYQHFSQFGKDVLSYEELITRLGRTLANNPKTIFIACHFANLGNDLILLGAMLDKYPNLYLDLSARDYEMGRTPRAALRFLERYQDRVMFGTDMGRQKKMYQAWWRLLETDDEYMPGRVWWQYYGLDLPSAVLEAIYRGTALKILNWD